MTSPSQADLAVAELLWLQENPDFEERPASIAEFLGPNYLNIDSGIRPGVRDALVAIFGEESNGKGIARVSKAMFTGAIGIGKTTLASIALPYMCHWVLCLRDPQTFFNLLPGSRIAFMQMSTSEDQAKEVLFGDIFARIKHSVWFRKYPYDPKFKNQIRFPKDIWIIPGDSAETTFEGYNILGGILDEIDSHRVTAKKDYAQSGYNTIHARISSRFGDAGLLILIGQMKKSIGFASRMYRELTRDSASVVFRMTIWESLGWDRFTHPNGDRDSFFYDPRNKVIVPTLVVQSQLVDTEHLIEVPTAYKKDFENDPVTALRDLAGIPPVVGSSFIGMLDRIYAGRDAWHTRFGLPSPVRPSVSEVVFEPWFRAPNTLPRACHLDIAYSDDGDALGFAMGHVPEIKTVGDEDRPVIVFDLLLRLRPLPGQEIILGDIRQLIYRLRDELGFHIKRVTMDGFQSTDMIQQLRKRRFNVDYLSVDKNKLPYQDLRDALYEFRLEFPRYETPLSHSDPQPVEIAARELSQLIDTGTKIDHPEGGSKDVTDAMAGVVFSLMGDRTYRRGVSSTTSSSVPAPSTDPYASNLPSFGVGEPGAIPIHPSLLRGAPQIPDRLRPQHGRY